MFKSSKVLTVYASHRSKIMRIFCKKMAEMQENQIPAGDVTKDEYLALFNQIVAAKQNSLNEMIKNLQAQVMADFEARTATLRSELGIINVFPAPPDSIVNKSIPYTDYTNKLIARVGHAFMTREVIHEVCNQITTHCAKTLTAEASEKAKKDFDLICNYSKRKKDNIPNTGTMYGKELCLYLMSKTFKKSAVDAYESYFAISDLVTSQTLANKDVFNVGSIGGGPGSDLVGSVAFIYDTLPLNKRASLKCQLTVFDIMDTNWKEAAIKPLNWGLYKYVRMDYDKQTDDRVHFEHIDFNKPETVDVEKLSKLDFITVCWALNEATFNEEFWTKVFQAASKAYILIVEGKEDKTDLLKTIADKLGRKVRYDRYENPRKLIILPQ